MSNIVLKCPHCNDYIEILEINCAIFRHGYFISNNEQINPHLKKDECDKLVENNLIYGCGKPFKVIKENNNYNAIICDYI